MAVNLVKAGNQVIGYNRSPERAKDLVAAGGKAVDSIANAVAEADIVAVMVPDSPDVQAVLTGDDGVFTHAKPGTLIIDFSSIRPDVAADLAEQARNRGFKMLDAPVSGGEPGAINAALSIMVGGSAADFEAAKPVLDAVGKTIVHVGPSGSGQTVKAANQLIVAGNIELLAEAIVFLEAYGVDTDAAVKVLGGGLAGSAVLNQKAQKMLDRDFGPGFRIDLHHKDLGIVTAAAREAGVVAPLGALVAQLMASARANGDGGLDHSGLFRGVERLSGRTPN
jgi:2-hydroxy-3-oxopropionate reductase